MNDARRSRRRGRSEIAFLHEQHREPLRSRLVGNGNPIYATTYDDNVVILAGNRGFTYFSSTLAALLITSAHRL
jgi:hypothetical protein